MQGTNQLVRSNWGLGVSLRDTSTRPGWDRTGNPPTARRLLLPPEPNRPLCYVMLCKHTHTHANTRACIHTCQVTNKHTHIHTLELWGPVCWWKPLGLGEGTDPSSPPPHLPTSPPPTSHTPHTHNKALNLPSGTSPLGLLGPSRDKREDWGRRRECCRLFRRETRPQFSPAVQRRRTDGEKEEPGRNQGSRRALRPIPIELHNPDQPHSLSHTLRITVTGSNFPNVPRKYTNVLFGYKLFFVQAKTALIN